MEDQPRLFNQFVQFNRNSLQGGGGSGLGLWICRNLCLLHGGKMDFRSDGLGTGSTFSVDLPLFVEIERLQESIIPTTPSFPLEIPSLSKVFPTDNREDQAPHYFEEVIDNHDEYRPCSNILIVDDSNINRY